MQFDCATQPMTALREAAYRIIPWASCLIETRGTNFVCCLQPKSAPLGKPMDADGLRQHFIDIVTDENLREKLTAETSRVRDVIVALAFGALASTETGG